MVNVGRQAGQPLSHSRRALSLGLQQPPGPQDGLPSPLGLQGGLEQGNELSTATTGREGSAMPPLLIPGDADLSLERWVLAPPLLLGSASLVAMEMQSLLHLQAPSGREAVRRSPGSKV